MDTEKLKDAILQAQECEKETKLWTSLTVAQWAQESGWGRFCPGNNPFGIKYSSTSPGLQSLWTTEVVALKSLKAWQLSHHELEEVERIGDDKVKIKVKLEFASYPTLKDAFVDHARLLTQGYRYKDIWGRHQLDTTPDKFIDEMAPVYATDPNYGNELKQIIADHQLTQFDHSQQPMEVTVTA